ncbi:MAG: proline transporter OpuE [Saprospiraceae bacterium]
MSIQLIVFILYFLIVFAIGFYSLRTTQDEKDYWIAGGNLGWLIGGSTLAATHTSAGTFIGTIGVIYTAGWSFGWLILAVVFAYWFMAAVLAPRFTKVKQLTLPAFMETRYYSKSARGVAAIIILIATVVYIQAQIVAGGLVANVVFGIAPTYGMIIFTVILLLYTMIGGMIAVAYTDFLQLIIMVIGVIVAVPLAIRQFGGFYDLLDFARAVNPITFTWDGLPGTLLFTMGLAFFLGGVSTPEKLTRLYAMRDMRTIRRGIFFTIILVSGINLLVFLLGIASISLFPNLPTGDLAMPLVAKAMLPPFIGTLMLAAITSAMMSTVDSLLLVAGSALSEDIYQTFFSPNSTQKQKLKIARIGIFIVGVIPLILVLSGVGKGELIQFIVLLFTALMASSFFMPVIGGLYWKRATKEGAIAAMIGGLLMTAIWKLFGSTGLDPVLPGFLFSGFLLIVVSLATAPPPERAIVPYFSD